MKMKKMIEIPVGSFIFWKNIKTFTSSLQRFWTNTIYSHISIYAGQMGGRDLEFEASKLVKFDSYNKRDIPKNDIIALKGVPLTIIQKSLDKIIEEYEGNMYGFFSWFTIFLRYLFQRMGFKNVHKWNILWGWGIHCSELGWYFLFDVISEMLVFSSDKKWLKLAEVVYEYDPDLFTPQDLRDIIDSNPLCFEWITAKPED